MPIDDHPSSAKPYQPPVSLLLETDGPTDPEFSDYAAVGIGKEHADELIRMVSDDSLHDAAAGSLLCWAPLHAWRAVQQLGIEEAIAPLIELLKRTDSENGDDWVDSEVPRVIASMGKPALEPLSEFLSNSGHGMYSRAAAAKGLEKLAEFNPELRAECIAPLIRQLEEFATNTGELNAFFICSLLELGAVESLPTMKRAFDANAVDEMITGDFEDAEISLGLKVERVHPRKPNKWTKMHEDMRANMIAAGILPDEDAFPGLLPSLPTNMPIAAAPKIGRNDPCPCNSGKKFKKCCGK